MQITENGTMMVILYVKNQESSKGFYETLLGYGPTLNVPGMTEFSLLQNVTLGLMPEDGIAKILGEKILHPGRANGVPRCELYLYVDEPDGYYGKLIAAGGTGISQSAARNWGDTVAYGADIDGHILAFAKRLQSRKSNWQGF